MRHEGFDETSDVFSEVEPCKDPKDPGVANCSIPKLLFENEARFLDHYPGWEFLHNRKVEFFSFLNSGGVTAKTRYVAFPQFALNFISVVDGILIELSGGALALQRQIILRKSGLEPDK